MFYHLTGSNVQHKLCVKPIVDPNFYSCNNTPPEIKNGTQYFWLCADFDKSQLSHVLRYDELDFVISFVELKI